jgi:hypothetical protein
VIANKTKSKGIPKRRTGSVNVDATAFRGITILLSTDTTNQRSL